jgi:hypothetical protein
LAGSSFTSISQRITEVLDKNPGCEITSLTFDTFGFSRGAAAARHFANEIVRGKQGPLGEVLRNNTAARLLHPLRFSYPIAHRIV